MTLVDIQNNTSSNIEEQVRSKYDSLLCLGHRHRASRELGESAVRVREHDVEGILYPRSFVS